MIFERAGSSSLSRLSLVAASGGRSLLRWADLSPRWSLGSWGCGSQALECRLRSCGHGLRCSLACRISLDQGLNLCLLHWQAIIYHRASRKAPSGSSLDLKEIPLFSLSPSTSFWPPCPYFFHKFLWLLSLFVPDRWQPPSSLSWGRGINKKNMWVFPGAPVVKMALPLQASGFNPSSSN